MTDAQIAGTFRQATADAAAAIKADILRQMKRNHLAILKEIEVLRNIIAHGEQIEYPWFDLPHPKMRQVAAVFEYLKAHPNRDLYKVPRAAREAFRAERGGYRTPGALASACYRCKVAEYAL